MNSQPIDLTAAAVPHSPVWRPTTQMQNALVLEVARAQGAELFLKNGDVLIDGISSWWVNLHGHCRAEIADAVAAQTRELEQVILAGFTHPQAERLAHRLLGQLPPKLTRCFFSDDGSTAVEVAVKMALQYFSNTGQPHRNRIIAFEDAYHGDTFGAMAVSGHTVYTRCFEPYLFEVYRLPPPYCTPPEAMLEAMRGFLAQGNAAAFIYEPLLQGAAGMQMHAPEMLNQLIGLAQQAGAFAIADEVFTGFGRTGKLWASDFCENKPDFMCLSKGITGGFLPMGFTAVTEKVYEAFLHNQKTYAFLHGHSYTGNALACAAANASLDLTLAEETAQNLRRIEAAHRAEAERLKQFDAVRNVRVLGTVLAFDCETQAKGYDNPLAARMYPFFLKNGVLLRPLGEIVYVLPPYVTTDSQLETLYAVIEKGLKTHFA